MPKHTHAVPRDDIVPHELSADCVCGPEIQLTSQGETVIVHHSLDGRVARRVVRPRRSPLRVVLGWLGVAAVILGLILCFFISYYLVVTIIAEIAIHVQRWA